MSYNNYPKTNWNDQISTISSTKTCSSQISPTQLKKELRINFSTKLMEIDSQKRFDDFLDNCNFGFDIKITDKIMCLYKDDVHYVGNFGFFEDQGIIYELKLYKNDPKTKIKYYKLIIINFTSIRKKIGLNDLGKSKFDFGGNLEVNKAISFKGKKSKNKNKPAEKSPINLKANIGGSLSRESLKSLIIEFDNKEIVEEYFHFDIEIDFELMALNEIKLYRHVGDVDRANYAIITDYDDTLDGNMFEDTGEVYFDTSWSYDIK